MSLCPYGYPIVISESDVDEDEQALVSLGMMSMQTMVLGIGWSVIDEVSEDSPML